MKPLRVEQFVFGEAPEASNTGFRALGRSAGLDDREVSELEQRANVGPTLTADRRQFRHYAHDHLSSGRHAWSMRVRSLTQQGEQKLINHILVTDSNEIRHLPDVRSLLSSTVREPDGRSLDAFRQTEGYRGHYSVVTLPALTLDVSPQPDRGDLLRTTWRDLLAIGDATQATRLLSGCLGALGQSRVRLVHENPEVRETIIHLVTVLMPIIDGMRLTWSTLASPRQWADYDICAVIPHEKEYIDSGVIVDGTGPENPSADARHILQWLAQESIQLEDLLNSLDKTQEKLFGEPTIVQWVRYQEQVTRSAPVTINSIPDEFELFREPALSEPGWLSPAPIARRIAGAIDAMKPATRTDLIEAIAVELEALRANARKALFPALVKELRKCARTDCVVQLMSTLMHRQSALSGSCVAEIELRDDVPFLKGHSASWTNLKSSLVPWLRLGPWPDSAKDTWIQMLVYSSPNPQATRALFEELAVDDALRAGRILYTGVSEGVSQIAEVAVRRSALERRERIDQVFSWASDRDPNAARLGLLDALTQRRIDKDTPWQFAARIVEYPSPSADVLRSWAVLVERWSRIGDQQIAVLVRQASQDTWSKWWARPLSAVSATTPATFAAVFARDDTDRQTLLRSVFKLIAAPATRKAGTQTIIECASIADGPVAASLEGESVEMQLRVQLSVLIEGVLRPGTARLWQARVRDTLQNDTRHAMLPFWSLLRDRYPVFAEDLAEQVAKQMNDDELCKFLGLDDKCVSRGVRRALMSRRRLPADSVRRFGRVWSRGAFSFSSSAIDRAAEQMIRTRSLHQ